ncbi:polysulfide reductase, partial [Streptomyces carpinensis]
ALLAGSVLQRFGTFEAGVTSTKDPAYVVQPQRRRLRRRSEGLEER